MRKRYLVMALTVSLAALTASANVTTPPLSQHASVTQDIGLVAITIDYGSPAVHAPGTHEDRHGKIWGGLVPYGLTDLGFGSCKQCPWRAGADWNTTFTVNHDVKIEGQPLKAGTYGLSMIAAAPDADWTIIFSNDNHSWGSFFYDATHDALRVKVKAAKNEYHEFLTYDFPDHDLGHAKVALEWEDLAVPFNVTVDNPNQLYVQQINTEFLGNKGFEWQNFVAATRWALQNKVALPDALEWAKRGADSTQAGQENFTTLTTLAEALDANGQTAEASKVRDKAINLPTTAIEMHVYARSLMAQGKKADAIAIWQLNAKKHGTEWPVNVGLMRANAAAGNFKEALKYAKLAAAQAPDEANKKALAGYITSLEAGKDIK